MTALAGLFAGVIMAMIVLPHAAILLVFRRRPAVTDGTVRDIAGVAADRHAVLDTPDADVEALDGSGDAWSVAAVAAGAFLTVCAFGIAAALLFTVAQRSAPTHIPGIPSLAYLVGVLVIPVFAAPWIAILAPRLWRHALFELIVFVAVFGIQIPMTAGVR